MLFFDKNYETIRNNDEVIYNGVKGRVHYFKDNMMIELIDCTVLEFEYDEKNIQLTDCEVLISLDEDQATLY